LHQRFDELSAACSAAFEEIMARNEAYNAAVK